jgi:hypothetical protein
MAFYTSGGTGWGRRVRSGWGGGWGGWAGRPSGTGTPRNRYAGTPSHSTPMNPPVGGSEGVYTGGAGVMGSGYVTNGQPVARTGGYATRSPAAKATSGRKQYRWR